MYHLVSIIMPAYNAEKYIAAAIQSVLSQTYRNWELIVVDDGSKDNTAEIMRRFSSKDGRIKYVFQLNGGQGKARNTGIENSSGDLVAFLDSDDLWLPEKLELQIKTMDETESDLVFSDAHLFSDANVSDETRSFSAVSGRFDGEQMFRLLSTHNPVPILTVLTRRDILDKVNVFDSNRRYCEDYDLWFKLSKHGAVFYGIKRILAKYRIHANATSTKRSIMCQAEIDVLEKHTSGRSPVRERAKGRLRFLYRELISGLIEEDRVLEAAQAFEKLSVIDKFGLITSTQRILINILSVRALPNWYYNSISWRLYKAELKITSIRRRPTTS